MEISEQEKQALEGEIHVKKPDSKILKGCFTIRHLLLRCVLTSWVGALSYLPKAVRMGNPI